MSGQLSGFVQGNPHLYVWDNGTVIHHEWPRNAFNDPDSLDFQLTGILLTGHTYRIMMNSSYNDGFNPGTDSWNVELTTMSVVPLPPSGLLFLASCPILFKLRKKNNKMI